MATFNVGQEVTMRFTSRSVSRMVKIKIDRETPKLYVLTSGSRFRKDDLRMVGGCYENDGIILPDTDETEAKYRAWKEQDDKAKAWSSLNSATYNSKAPAHLTATRLEEILAELSA